jgi:hypothetical protein
VLNTKRRCPIAKRFIDTDIFKKQFVRSLQAPYKLLWIYILQDCNHAGIWDVDMEVAQIRISEKINQKSALFYFAGKVFEISGGSKWFIPEFISFQYGELNPENRAHNSVISILKKEALLNENLTIKELYKPLTSPLQGAKDMDKDKDMVKDMDKVKDKGEKKFELVFPFCSVNFMVVWDLLLKEKKWRKKSFGALQASLELLSKHSEDDAIQMMKNTIAGEWQGLFEIDKSKKQNSNGKRLDKNGETIISGRVTEEGAARTLAGLLLHEQRKKDAAGDFVG